MSTPRTAAGRALSERMVGNADGWLADAIVAIEDEAVDAGVMLRDALAAYDDLRAALRAESPAVEPEGLDAAWKAAEAALPEGDYRTIVVSGYRCKLDGCGSDYVAHVEGPNGERLEGSSGRGTPTPAAALLALAARLSETPR